MELIAYASKFALLHRGPRLPSCQCIRVKKILSQAKLKRETVFSRFIWRSFAATLPEWFFPCPAVALSPSAPSIPAPRRLVVHMLETPDLKLVLEALNMGAVFQWKGGVFLLKVHVMLQNLGG